MTRLRDLELTVTFSNFSDPVTRLNSGKDSVSKTNLVAPGKLNFEQAMILNLKAIWARLSSFVYSDH